MALTAFVAILAFSLTGFPAFAAVSPETGGNAASPLFGGNITGAHAAGLPRFSEITTGPRTRPAKPVAEVAQGAANDAVVPPVKREQPAKSMVQPPPAQAPAAPAPQPSAKRPEAVPLAQVGSKGGPSSSQGGGVVDAVQDWLARANREYQGVLMKQLSVPTNANGDAIARKLEEQKAEDAKKADEAKTSADAKHLEDERRQAAEARQRQAEDERRKLEAAAKAEEARQAQAFKQAQAAKPPEPPKVEPAKPEPAKPAEAAKKPEEQKKVEEPKKAEEARKPEALVKPDDAKAAEERRNAEAALKVREAAQLKEAERIAEERRKQELQRQAEQKKSEQNKAGDDRRKADAAAAAMADEARRAGDDRRKAEARAAEDRAAEDKRRAQEVEAEKHRKRAVTITAEPVVRPPADPTPGRPELAVPDKPSRATKKDNRIAEGSAETGPVDDDGAAKSGSAKSQSARSNPESAGRSAHNRIRRWDWRPRRERHMSCRAAGRLVTPPAHYVVRRGDSLWRISERHYHKGRHYKVIYRANRSRISDPDLIYPCQRFFLPLRH